MVRYAHEQYNMSLTSIYCTEPHNVSVKILIKQFTDNHEHEYCSIALNIYQKCMHILLMIHFAIQF